MNHSSYTKQRIFNAFNELLDHTPFEKITVEMIIRQSGVSKSTFYRHFHDKYDVLNFNSMALAERLIGQRVCHSWKEFLFHMFRGISEDSCYYRRAFRSSGQNAHSGFLYSYSFGIVANCYLTTTGKSELSVRDRYSISHYCHGCVGILQEWLNDMDALTPGDMAEIFYEAMPEYLRDTWVDINNSRPWI